jgi:gamma-glutamyltranspeptidase/glutathione hydrolase
MTPTRGAVAGGSPHTVDAGLRALRLGGNAADAAISAQLTACVAEPMFTGLLGAGLAMVRFGGQAQVLDFFANVPGLGGSSRPAAPMESVRLDFGPDSQVFHVGPGTVAVPGVVEGLWALHQRHGSLPMTVLAEPAIRAAQRGVPTTGALAVAAQLLNPIISHSPRLAALLRPGGRLVQAGDPLHQTTLAQTLQALASDPQWLRTGPGAHALLELVGGHSHLTARDLAEHRAHWRAPISGTYRGARLSLPGPPSQAGALALHTLAALQAGGPMPAPHTGPHLARIARAMRQTEAAKGTDFQARLFDPGFVDGWLGPNPVGHTTHISVIDQRGDAVSITTSLGETAGLMCPTTGLMPNNFLGESDVNPPSAHRPPGARLMTMCCPALLEHRDRTLLLGTGGSSRIRSALLHAVIHAVDHDLEPQALVDAPRAHFEDATLRYESPSRPPSHRAALGDFASIVEFAQPSLYFGGLNIVGQGAHGFFGAGDQRRSGVFREV